MIYLIPILLMIAGCVTPPPPPDFHAMRQAQTIDLPGHSAEAITEAAVRMFTLADKDDVMMHPTIRGMVAGRLTTNADPFSAGTNERYEFEIVDGRAVVVASVAYDGVLLYPYSTAVYDLIRARIRHLLGENEPWKSCDDVEGYSWSNVYHHPYLCMYADDHRPE